MDFLETIIYPYLTYIESFKFFGGPTSLDMNDDVKAVTYINKIDDWWPPESIMKDLGVPEYNDSRYNVFNISFWLPPTGGNKGGPVDIALLWSNPVHYFGKDTKYGADNDTIRTNLLKAYHDKGKKVLLSAFGATAPGLVDAWEDAETTCTELADFALENQFDGIDLDYECNACMEAKVDDEDNSPGNIWLEACVKAIRAKMPMGKYLLTMAPQAPYFTTEVKYPGQGFIGLDKAVGDMIDWYNIQYYNQVSTKYETCETLMVKADGWAAGTAVKELIASGIPEKRIVIGKPVNKKDATNTGFMPAPTLGSCFKQYPEISAGFMTWQFSSDLDSAFAETVLDGWTDGFHTGMDGQFLPTIPIKHPIDFDRIPVWTDSIPTDGFPSINFLSLVPPGWNPNTLFN